MAVQMADADGKCDRKKTWITQKNVAKLDLRFLLLKQVFNGSAIFKS